MKVLVATEESQGTVDDDYCWTVDGELVYIQGLDCDSPGCGCTLGFAGMGSSRATTTAKVVERPDLTESDVVTALTESFRRGGWLEWLDTEEVAEMIGETVALLAAITDAAPVGALVRRDGDQILVK